MPRLGIAIRVKGVNVGRSLRKKFGEASLPAWEETGKQFHTQYRPKRFTEEHARAARYGKRKESYLKRKERQFGHRDPLKFSGEVFRLTRTAGISARKGTGQIGNQGGVKVTYRGARKLNLRHPNSQIKMNEEFTRITRREATTLGLAFETRFKQRFERL